MSGEDFITLNKREQRLLKEYMSHHGWNDLLVTYPNKDKTYRADSDTVKKYGGIRERFKMSISEIDEFRSKMKI